MKKFFRTLANIWSIQELRRKIVYTLLLIFVYRLGTHVILPGIDPGSPAFLPGRSVDTGLLGLFNTFAGGAFSNASIFALGIIPYISASIFMQLAGVLIPQIQKIQRDGGSGREKINQWTRLLTIVFTTVQGVAYVSYLKGLAARGELILYPSFTSYFWLSTVLLLVAGTLFVMWIGERIQDKGIGNGTSIIIMVGILSRFPQSLLQEFQTKVSRGGGLIIFLLEIVALIFIVLLIVLLLQGTRRIPLNYAKQVLLGGGRSAARQARQYLPLKVNAAGVMPIIFAQAIMFLPTLFSFTNMESAGGIVRIFSDHSNPWYMLVYGVTVVAFTFLYTALIFNPRQISDDIKRNGGFIPGVQQGNETANFIGTIMDRITLPGAFFLAALGLLPGLASMLGVTVSFSNFFGGTSLLIMVGVILDVLQQIETQLYMNRYDGLIQAGRMQGRTT